MDQQKKMISRVIFSSRWLQSPLYLGLIGVLLIYVYQFSIELTYLFIKIRTFNKTETMLHALDLIDVVMIANLLIMVIVGGYETFVSRLNIREHVDHPEWLNEMNAGSMKVKFALSLIGISSIHLLRTFMDTSGQQSQGIMWQVLIHMTLVFSAIAIAITNKLMINNH